MKVKMEFLGHIRNLIGSNREEEIEVKEGASISDLLMILSEKYGESFKKSVYERSGADIKSNYIITVNGYLLNQLKGLETKLRNNDHVTLLPIVSGG